MEKITLNTTISEALKNERAVAAIEEIKPGITKHPLIKMFKNLPLSKLPSVEQLHLTQEKLESLIDQVNAAE